MKHYLGKNVLQASVDRIAWIFANFPKIYLSFSGGKDSTVMFHLAAEEARRQGRKFGVLFVDLEGQYKITIEHIEHMVEEYADIIDLYWVSLPISLRNGVSVYQPQWECWNPDREADWVRRPSNHSITKPMEGWGCWYKRGMEFEDFVPEFGKWYADGQMCACMVGIRTVESLNRYRSLARDDKQCLNGLRWTTYICDTLFNAYPIYDWKTEDIWVYHGKTKKPHNRLYDLMHKAGLSIHQQRICQPYGDDQRKGLWLFQLIEPQTWARIVARVNGANSGALYAKESGNINGVIKATLPDGHTWQSFAELLLSTMPPKAEEHYRIKISVFLKWWEREGYPKGIPDFQDRKLETSKKVPSWRRICKTLLRNDYWCKGLSFTQHKTAAYKKYLKMKKKRGHVWKRC